MAASVKDAEKSKEKETLARLQSALLELDHLRKRTHGDSTTDISTKPVDKVGRAAANLRIDMHKPNGVKSRAAEQQKESDDGEHDKNRADQSDSHTEKSRKAELESIQNTVRAVRDEKKAITTLLGHHEAILLPGQGERSAFYCIDASYCAIRALISTHRKILTELEGLRAQLESIRDKYASREEVEKVTVAGLRRRKAEMALTRARNELNVAISRNIVNRKVEVTNEEQGLKF